jgi:hypothetical protein
MGTSVECLQRDTPLLQLLLLLQSLLHGFAVSRAESSLLHIFLLLPPPPAKLEAMLRGWKVWQRYWGKPHPGERQMLIGQQLQVEQCGFDVLQSSQGICISSKDSGQLS